MGSWKRALKIPCKSELNMRLSLDCMHTLVLNQYWKMTSKQVVSAESWNAILLCVARIHSLPWCHTAKEFETTAFFSEFGIIGDILTRMPEKSILTLRGNLPFSAYMQQDIESFFAWLCGHMPCGQDVLGGYISSGLRLTRRRTFFHIFFQGWWMSKKRWKPSADDENPPPMLKQRYLQSAHICAFHEPKIIQFARRITEIEHFRQAKVSCSIFSVFHRGENRHKNGDMFGKLVLSDAERFFNDFGLTERAMYTIIEILDFVHRRKVFNRSAERFTTRVIPYVYVVLKRSAERLKTFRRCTKSNISIIVYIARSVSPKSLKNLSASLRTSFPNMSPFLCLFSPLWKTLKTEQETFDCRKCSISVIRRANWIILGSWNAHICADCK